MHFQPVEQVVLFDVLRDVFRCAAVAFPALLAEYCAQIASVALSAVAGGPVVCFVDCSTCRVHVPRGALHLAGGLGSGRLRQILRVDMCAAGRFASG